MRGWVKRIKAEGAGVILVGSKALTPEHQRTQELEAVIKRIEREKEILKKTTALSILIIDKSRVDYSQEELIDTFSINRSTYQYRRQWAEKEGKNSVLSKKYWIYTRW